VVSRWTGVPVTSIKEEETQKLLRVEEECTAGHLADKAISARRVLFVDRVRTQVRIVHRQLLVSRPPALAKPRWHVAGQFLFGSDRGADP